MTTLRSPRTSRKPARETHGTCYLKATGALTLAQALDSGDALLTIHADRCTNYLVQRLTDPDGETVGFRMMKLTDYIIDRKVYDIDITPGYGWPCDCPDALYQNRECKHVRALRAALTQNGITIAAPKRQQPTPKPEAKQSTTCPFCLRTKCEC
jgi:hypothetical protein